MAAQRPQAGKKPFRNYIGLLSQNAEAQAALELQAKSDGPVRQSLLAWLAAMLKPGRDSDHR